MPKLTLAERLQRAAERKARAEQEQARLKIMQRKERTRRLIELGGLAVKAGIDGLSTAALYDRFLAIAAEAKDPARWRTGSAPDRGIFRKRRMPRWSRSPAMSGRSRPN